MLESTVTIEGQTTLPMAVRDSLEVRPGTGRAMSSLTRVY